MVMVTWCRRSGASGTATWPSAGRQTPIRCWKSRRCRRCYRALCRAWHGRRRVRAHQLRGTLEKRNLPGAWETLQANVYYNEADHVMDNHTLRTPNPNSMMPMPMA